MTINSATRTAGPFAGTGVVASYPFAFKVFQASDLLVTKTDAAGVQTVLALSVDYTVTLNSDQNTNPGGAIGTLSALPVGYSLSIVSNVTALQPLSLTNTGGFYPRAIEDALDRIVIILQQLGVVSTAQTLRVPELSGVPLLPPIALRASRVLGFDSAGNPTGLLPAPGDATALALDLLSTASSKGANLVGLQDAADYFPSSVATVEAAVASLALARKREVVVTDYPWLAKSDNSADAGAALTAAAVYLHSIGGGTLRIPAGTYRLDTQFQVPYGNIRIAGAGMGATVLRCNAWVDGIQVANGYPAATSVLNNITIQDLSINGDRANHTNGPSDTYGNGINLNACDQVVIRNCEVYDMEQQGIVSTYWVIAGALQDSIVIDNCIVRNTQLDRTAIGIEGRGRAAYVTNNAVINGGSIYVGHESGSGTDNGECIVQGNRCQGGATGIGIAVRDNLYNISVVDNVVTGYDIGIRASSIAQPLSKFLINDNQCFGWVSYGILVSPMSGTDSTNALVSGNRLLSTTGTAAIGVAKGATVVGNRIEGTAGVGISATGGNCRIFSNDVTSTGYSVDLGAAIGNVVTGNYLSADLNTTAAALTNSFFANYGSATNRGSDYFLGINRYTNGNAAPVAGAWLQGDMRFNSAPSNAAGQPAGWVCCVAGTPGTWRPFGVTT